tara:strand:- start:227 stop:844 length:618 start_codon:yes stop_codon:yes gene_type:complete
MEDLLTDLLSMPYYKNYSATSGAVHGFANHEEAISKILIKHKFIKQEKNEGKLDLSSIKKRHFIEQPYGTHKNPDFIVRLDSGYLLNIEAKSSNGVYPMYNSGNVHPDYLYVFCSKKYNATTIYKGSLILPLEQSRLIEEYIKEIKRRDKEFNIRLSKLDTTHRGFKFYTRPMYIQKGGSEYTDYFKHSKRLEVEKATIEWATHL